MIKSILAVVVTILATNAVAGELVIHLGSQHTAKTYAHRTTAADGSTRTEARRFNNANVGLGYISDGGWLVGSYHNSYDVNTIYAGRRWMFTEQLGVVTALATGYREGRLQPTVALTYALPIGRKWSLNALAMPPAGQYEGVLHLTLNYNFKGD